MRKLETFGNRELHEKMEEKTGSVNLSETVATKPLRELNPIFIKAFRERAEKRRPHEILNDYESKKEFYGVSSLDQRELVKFNSLFYKAVPDHFDAVEVSPISPFGLNSVITKVSQDILLSTIRGSEVVGDPTTPLALECASRRKNMLVNKQTRMNSVNLATSQRVLRLQKFDQDKGYMQHFSLFGLCTGGRDHGGESFMTDSLSQHISTWLDFVEILKNEGYTFDDVSLKISDIQVLERIIRSLLIPRNEITKNSLNEDFDFFEKFGVNLPREVESIEEIDDDLLEQHGLKDLSSYLLVMEQKILQPLRKKYPWVRFCFDFNRKAGLGYYQKACFHIFATNSDGRNVQLADGGTVDWLEKLLDSKKERAVTSGFGAELVQKLFCS